MSDFKAAQGFQPHTVSDAVSVRGDAEDVDTEGNDLPVATYDDYKTWCDKVRQEWDIN
ncbi:MAG: hypothetical protein AB8G18_06135 [Gammaproteobacteria bacterium]